MKWIGKWLWNFQENIRRENSETCLPAMPFHESPTPPPSPPIRGGFGISHYADYKCALLKQQFNIIFFFNLSVYLFIHTSTCKHAGKHRHTYMHAHKHRHAHKHIQLYVHTSTHIRVHMHIQTWLLVIMKDNDFQENKSAGWATPFEHYTHVLQMEHVRFIMT